LKGTYERVDRLEVDLSDTKQDLEKRTQIYEQLHEEQQRANEELVRAENQLNSVNIANANLSAELRKTSAEEARLAEESGKQWQIIQQLEAQTQKDKKHIDVLEDDLKRYQDSLAYLSRQIDEEKLRNLDFAILEKERDALVDDVAAKEEEIQSLYNNYINKPR
jgi:chromosome segregation ATPase